MLYGFTETIAKGAWKGGLEDTLILEIATDQKAEVERLAQELKIALNQEAVGVLELPLEMRFL